MIRQSLLRCVIHFDATMRCSRRLRRRLSRHKDFDIRCMFECAISFAAGNGGEWCLPAKNVAGTYHQRVASSWTVQSVDDFDLTELHRRVILHVLLSKWAFWGLPFKVNKALRDAPKLPQDLRFKRLFVFWPELIRSYKITLILQRHTTYPLSGMKSTVDLRGSFWTRRIRRLTDSCAWHV